LQIKESWKIFRQVLWVEKLREEDGYETYKLLLALEQGHIKLNSRCSFFLPKSKDCSGSSKRHAAVDHWHKFERAQRARSWSVIICKYLGVLAADQPLLMWMAG
jgi:hypothetical protein